MNKLDNITCPTCGKSNTWNKDNRYKPFCSDRCKLIDLGEWANESRKIPSSPASNDLDNFEHEGNDDFHE